MKHIKTILGEVGFHKGMTVEQLKKVMAQRRITWKKKNQKNEGKN